MINQKSCVGDIVKLHFQTVKIFEDHQIDFCCGGNQPLEEACEKKSVDLQEILLQLEKAIQIPISGPKFDEMPLDELIQYIQEKHHAYIREQIPMLSKLLNKIEKVHGAKHPEIEIINAHFKESVLNLDQHLEREETELFPLIKSLENQKREGCIPSSLSLNAKKTISVIMQEHENEGTRFKEISRLTNSYQPLLGACNTFRTAYENLQAFEKDLHRHVHLENNILFPKAIELEQKVNN